MCGLVGYFAPSGTLHEDSFRASLQAIAHRGPDDEGINYFEGTNGIVCLAHRRLSIIDLSANGHQPFFDNTGRYAMVYNGEVFNYTELRTDLEALGITFRTKTDTEVVLESWKYWGNDCWRKFTGMFSVVIYDRKIQNLVMARDPFGIKPLYYRCEQNSVFFASEIPALIKLLPSRHYLNIQRAIEYLVFDNYDNDEKTFFEGVSQLLPGHFLSFDLSKDLLKTHPVRWWIPDIAQRTTLTFTEATEKLRELFLQSVRLHLRSDVPVGAALSGGIDSSSVVCAMRYLEQEMPIHTFTYVAAGTNLNEENWADFVNKRVNANVNKVYIQSDDLLKDLTDLIRTQGEPFSGTSIYAQYRIFKRAKEKGIKVTLDGQGADELLGGYYGYPERRIRSFMASNSWIRALNFSKNWAGRLERSASEPWLHAIASMMPEKMLFRLARLLGKVEIPSWLDLKMLKNQGVVLNSPKTASVVNSRDRKLMEQLANELIALRIPRLLRYADRNSMRFSIESRVPFLTIDLANFMYGLPEEFLVSDKAESKHIFREAMRGIVPNEILDRKDKIGFETPERELIKKMGLIFNDNLLSLGKLPFLKTELLTKQYNDAFFDSPSLNNRHWRIINLIIWMNIFDVQCK
ncbi:MAG: asparagine synthase (glutamine-hydrolyzing) [Bacteroidetes bacterium]|nr:asparagine synthase (glutamine-hydrolyzing) [Bacteroidota bacterium]